MIKFDVADDGDLRQVVHELRPLVEIGRVVFVALNDKVVAICDAKARAEILDESTDEKARIQPSSLHHPRRDARRRRLAVRARDDERATPADKLFLDRLGLRAIEQATIQSLFQLRIAARDDIADDDAIGRRLKVLGLVTLHDGDAQLREHRGHRRIDVFVRPCNLVPARL